MGILLKDYLSRESTEIFVRFGNVIGTEEVIYSKYIESPDRHFLFPIHGSCDPL